MYGSTRWRRHLWLSRLLQVAVFALPALAGFAASMGAAEVLPPPSDLSELVLWWATLLSVSLLAVVTVDPLARHLLPLSVLLELSLVFPDHLPSRLRLAFRAGRFGRLKARVREQYESETGLGSSAAGSILSLVAALGVHDRRTRRHSERVRAFSDLIAEEMGLEEAERERLRWGALLHDVGKLAVKAEILNKHGSPSDREWETIYRHPTEGARMVEPLLPWLGPWVGAIEQHHERWDGSGYPLGLRGEEIALGARIVAVADAYDTMTAARSYKGAASPDRARQELVRMAGSQFDPAVVRSFLSLSLRRPPGWLVGPLSVLSSLLAGLRRLRESTVLATALIALTTAAATGVLGPSDWNEVGVDDRPIELVAWAGEGAATAEPPVVRPAGVAVMPAGRIAPFRDTGSPGDPDGDRSITARAEPHVDSSHDSPPAEPAADLLVLELPAGDGGVTAELDGDLELAVQAELGEAALTAEVGEGLDVGLELRLGETAAVVDPDPILPAVTAIADTGEESEALESLSDPIEETLEPLDDAEALLP